MDRAAIAEPPHAAHAAGSLVPVNRDRPPSLPAAIPLANENIASEGEHPILRELLAAQSAAGTGAGLDGCTTVACLGTGNRAQVRRIWTGVQKYQRQSGSEPIRRDPSR